jgi:hypothetical protein
MLRLYADILKAHAPAKAREYLKGKGVIFDSLTPTEARIFRRALRRKLLLSGFRVLPLPDSSLKRMIAKISIYGGLAYLFGYDPEEYYRFVKPGKEPGTEEVLVPGGPVLELEKLYGRTLLQNIILNLASIPQLGAALLRNKDWKGDPVYDEQAPEGWKEGGQNWQKLAFAANEYFSPLGDVKRLFEDSQTPKAKQLMQYLSFYIYTRKAKADPAWKYKFKIDEAEEAVRAALRDPTLTDKNRKDVLTKNLGYIAQHVKDMQKELKAKEPKNLYQEMQRMQIEADIAKTQARLNAYAELPIDILSAAALHPYVIERELEGAE